MFGFQQQSVANQLEHLDSLLVWSLTKVLTTVTSASASHAAAEAGEADPELDDTAWASAVQALHTKLLAPVESWRERIFDTSSSSGANAARFHRVRRSSTFARVGLVAAGGRASHWAMLDTEEQLRELVLFLCVWGEAAQLRFMPQLVYFIFELARAHASQHLETAFAAADDFDFLNRVVRPIYTQLKAEIDRNALSVYYDFRNHDDFNEAFWSATCLRKLRLKPCPGPPSSSAAAATTAVGGVGLSNAILDQEPGTRYRCLRDADWESWFACVPKAHREHVWWSSLLVANRRIFLLHAIAFGLGCIGAQAFDFPIPYRQTTCPPPPHECDYGWRWWWAIPPVALLAPLASFVGRWYEADLTQAGRGTVARVRNAFWLLALSLCLSASVYFVQAQLSFCEYRCFILVSWILPGSRATEPAVLHAQLTGLHIVSMLSLTLLSVLTTVRELFWPCSIADRSAVDNQQDFERRLEALQGDSIVSYRRVVAATARGARGGAFASVSSASAEDIHLASGGGGGDDEPEGAARLEHCLSHRCCAVLQSLLPVALLVATFLALVAFTDVPILVAAAAAVGAALLLMLAVLAATNTCLERWLDLALAVKEAARMYTFWLAVGVAKLTFALGFEVGTCRTLMRATHAMLAADVLPRLLCWSLEGTIRAYLLGALWYLGALIFVADSLGWYQLVLAVWGGVPRVVRSYTRQGLAGFCRKVFRCKVGGWCTLSELWTVEEIRRLKRAISRRLVDHKHLTPSQQDIAAGAYWSTIVDELYTEHFISREQKGALAAGTSDVQLTSAEANRRLRNFAVSLEDEALRPSRVFRAPGLTTLIPSYNEAILNDLPSEEASRALKHATDELRHVTDGSALDRQLHSLLSLLLLTSGAACGAAVAAVPHFIWHTETEGHWLPTAAIVCGVAVALFGLAVGAYRFQKRQRQKDQMREYMDKLRVGGVVFANGASSWQRQTKGGRFNFEDQELVQTAQLMLRQALEADMAPSSPRRRSRHRRAVGLAGADSMHWATNAHASAAAAGGGGGDTPSKRTRDEQRSWLTLPLYRPPANRAQPLTLNEMGFLMSEFAEEWQLFHKGGGESWTCDWLSTRKWASARMQTVYRTVHGMSKNFRALQMQLTTELSTQLSGDEILTLMKHKHRTLWALQTLASFKGQELKDVAALMQEWAARGVAIATLESVGKKHYSTCYQAGPQGEPIALDTHGKLVPAFRIELPGPGILGEGKGNNQNCAIHFSRGHILQAIDMNQEGYIEEAFKVACALSEFDCARPPAIVGFPEHVFSGLYALGDFAASAELAFGRLMQSTMAASLQSRYHYGHPDMFDKFAMIGQGGMSKAMKKLHVSEDIFAGMDAVLRGHTIKHVEYFQVGKGRDMGLVSVLSFFSKLSAGTAMMTTSRQAMRLGQRLGLAKLLGFYYAHIGYYAGQLHYYHAAYGMVALAYLGVLTELTGLAPGVAAPCVELFNNMNGPFMLLMLLFSVLPLVFITWEREGLLSAIAKPLKQILQLAPLFFILQGRCIGHYFSRTVSLGEAAYVATGRGLSVEHTPFHKLFAFFAVPCFYPGAELGAFLACLCTLSWRQASSAQLLPLSVAFGTLMPLGLLLGPALLNPHALRLTGEQSVLEDFKRWASWLVHEHYAVADDANADRSWSEFHQRRCNDKRSWSSLELLSLRGERSLQPSYAFSPRAKYFALPSKELLLALPHVLIAWHTLRRVAWHLRALYLADIIFPVVPFVLLLSFVLARSTLQMLQRVVCPAWMETRVNSSNSVYVYVFFAALTLGATVATEGLRFLDDVTASGVEVVALLACRYFCWRVALNVLAYFAMSPEMPTTVVVSFDRAAVDGTRDPAGQEDACAKAFAAALKSDPEAQAIMEGLLSWLRVWLQARPSSINGGAADSMIAVSETVDCALRAMLEKDDVGGKVAALREFLHRKYPDHIVPEYDAEWERTDCAWRSFYETTLFKFVDDERGNESLVTIAPSNIHSLGFSRGRVSFAIVAADATAAEQLAEHLRENERPRAACAKLRASGFAVSSGPHIRWEPGILASGNGDSLHRKLARGTLRPVRSQLKKSALFDLALHVQPLSQLGSLRGLLSLVLEPLRVASAATLNSVAFLIDLLLGATLQLVPLVLAAFCAVLCAVSCGHVDIDDAWYRWLMNEVARSKKRLKPEDVVAQLRGIQPAPSAARQGGQSAERVADQGPSDGGKSALEAMSVRTLKLMVQHNLGVHVPPGTEKAELVRIAMENIARLSDVDPLGGFHAQEI